MTLGEAVDALERRVDQLERLLAAPVLPFRHDDGRLRRQRLPKFWPDGPVRDAVFELHRQVPLDTAIARLVASFGKKRAPSRTALQRFWMRLDLAHGRDGAPARESARS